MFLIPLDEERTYALKPMNCPGHMLLFGSRLRSYRDLPIRYAESSTLHRNELAGTLHGLTARPARHAGRRAHLLHAEQIEDEIDGCLDFAGLPLRPVRASSRAAELSTRPENKLGTDEEWDFTEGALQRGARAARHRVRRRTRATARSTGRRSTCT